MDNRSIHTETKTNAFAFVSMFLSFPSCAGDKNSKDDYAYEVFRLNDPLTIDGEWEKAQWREVVPVHLTHYMGIIPGFQPEVRAKMAYDEDNIYVIFQVKDCLVRCLTSDVNGPVYKDSAVEFFSAPDSSLPERYFNLETNCGGTPLMQYHTVPRIESEDIAVEDIKKIEIAHSLPQIVDPEIGEPVAWTIEYRIPLKVLEKYAGVTLPAKDVEWRNGILHSSVYTFFRLPGYRFQVSESRNTGTET